MKASKLVCFIAAKAASTRLKKKNILPLAGKELIYYPIRNGLDCGLFAPEDVIVSTESKEIQQIAKKHGANVPYTRADKLAYDPYGVADVGLDFLERFPKYQNYDALCFLSATAPLTSLEDIQTSYKVFSEGGFDSLMTVTETEHNALRSIYVREGKIEAVDAKSIFKKSQELEKTYRINGAAIWVNIKKFIKQRTYFLEKWGASVMPSERSVDIDNMEGYLYAKFLAENK